MSRRRPRAAGTHRMAPDQSHGTRVPASTPQTMGQPCPDVERVWTECQAAGVPVSRRYLRGLYSLYLENAQTDWDFGGWVLTYLTRSGSRPVDGAVGERVASGLAGASV